MKRNGFTLTEMLVAILSVGLMMFVLMPALRGARASALRIACRTNLIGIGRAMAAYADDNEGSFPVAGPPGTMWTTRGYITKWAMGGPEFKTGATISSSFYLLILHGGVMPKQFVCPGDDGVEIFDLSKINPRMRPESLYDAFDFGDWRTPFRPGDCVSYSYHMPYYADDRGEPGFPINGRSRPESPVCADRNPYLDRNADYGNLNSAAHREKGQNVLYKDGHVRFERDHNVGLGGDNIWTYGDTEPVDVGEGVPVDERDAYLVNEVQS